VRIFDGEHNPIGKAFSKQKISDMLIPYFHIDHIFYHFFPARSLPFKIPLRLHKILDKYSGFMIYLKCKKK
ncbi:MAG TPA: hypothetical protein DIT99_06805, partial [Candidatus Latescibacteria bacterium]|nr:hypothetical protein [Candidatus Latescibacterota bacterium]